jgi:sulfonate transport system permease protein
MTVVYGPEALANPAEFSAAERRFPVLVDILQRRRTPRLGVNPPGWLRRLAGPVLLLVLWQAGVSVSGADPELVPGPIDVAKAAATLIDNGQLAENLSVSLVRVIQGLGLGLVFGTAFAVLAGLRRQSGEILDSAMQVLKAVPVFALLPLFIVWTGIGEAPKIALIAVTAALPIYINTYSAIKNVDGDLAEVASILGLSQWGVIRHVLLPGSVSGFLSGLRISLTSAWLALIFAETINAKSGLGYLMIDAQMAFRMDIIVLVVTVYAVLGIIGYGIVLGLERVLLPWRRGFKGL